MEDRMYGVVLWADEKDAKAVIWCEDQGNLAFYSGTEHCAHKGVALDAGDLIQFDLREDREIRQAKNLQRVDAGYAPGLPDSLRRHNNIETNIGTPGNVVSFPKARAC